MGQGQRAAPEQRGAVGAEQTALAATGALIVIDLQNCFIPGGSLEFKKGDEVVPIICPPSSPV